MANQFTDGAVPSLAQLLSVVGAPEDLAAGRKAEIRSAAEDVRVLVQAVLTEIPAHPKFLRRRFEPAAHGVKPKRLSNVKSALLFAIRCAGDIERPSYLAPFNPEWRRLWDRLPEKFARTSFSRFSRYCSARNLSSAIAAMDPSRTAA